MARALPKRSLFPAEESYIAFLQDMKARIRKAQVRAALAVNQEMVMLYWQLGREILARQKKEGWGAKVIERLSKDLQREFPGLKGVSPRNLKYMKAFAEAYPDEQMVQRCAAQIPWRHNQLLLDKLKDPEQRLWYAQKSLENGWSRDVLAIQIETNGDALDLWIRFAELISKLTFSEDLHRSRTLPKRICMEGREVRSPTLPVRSLNPNQT